MGDFVFRSASLGSRALTSATVGELRRDSSIIARRYGGTRLATSPSHTATAVADSLGIDNGERSLDSFTARFAERAVELWPALDGAAQRRQPLGGTIKRVIDVAVALIALVVMAPAMLVIAGLVRLTMGGPAIFAHHRLGFDGKGFVCFKFRTMAVNADEILARHLKSNAQAAEEWRCTRKLVNDPRVGCVGRVLRKSSLDELPQIFNILRGDMSVVGPRPIVAEEVKRYGRYAREYFMARPGLTGIWQASGRNRLSYARRVALDRYYVRHWSIRLDLMLILKTVPAILNTDQTA